MLNNTEMQLRYEDEILSAAIENRISTAVSTCNTIIVHLNDALRSQSAQMYPSMTTATQKIIYRCMINTFTMFNDAEQICVVWDNGTCFYQSLTENYSMYSGETELIRELDAHAITREGQWLTSIRSDCPVRGNGQYFTKLYTDINTGKRLGYIVVKLRTVFNVLDISSDYRTFYLFNRGRELMETTSVSVYNDIIVAAGNYENHLALSKKLFMDITDKSSLNDTDFINETALGKGWLLVSYSDLRDTADSLYKTITYILIIALFILGLMFAAVSFVISRVTTPIKKLSNHMASFQSELPAPISIDRYANDETGILINQFNEMAIKTAGLVNQVLEEKHRQKQLEFALLQSQIKPHFLYNTLDTIYCLSCMDRPAEASNVTKLLSDYYRLVLSSGLDEIKLGAEIETVRKYMEIQIVRYRGTLSYSIDADESVTDIKIPKLTLQPLVENAIYHGVKPSGRPGCVNISAKRNGCFIEVRVTDDGVGIKGNGDIDELSESFETGFGLRSVKERLRLYYGDKYEFMITSQSIGTCALIRVRTDP